MRRRTGVALAALLAVGALTGCTPGGSAPTAAHGFHLAQIDGGPRTPDRTIRTDRVAAAPANGYEWTVDAVDRTSREVRLHYVDGACTTADRLRVDETTTTVTIGITASKSYSGTCSTIGILRSVTVLLQRPLGGRALMEASSGPGGSLPEVADPATLPTPTCGPDGVSDVPVGMVDAGTRIAPTAATRAFVCRTWWPKGIAHEESRTITDRAAVASLVASMNSGVRDLRPGPVPRASCSKDAKGSWYAVYLEGPALQVEVRTDEITCSTITNGALSGTMSPALMRRLDALFG